MSAPKSRRSAASKLLRESSTMSGVVDSSAISLPLSSARRSAAARASAMSVYVVNRSTRPCPNNMTCACRRSRRPSLPSGRARLSVGDKHHAMPEIENLLRLGQIVLVVPKPVFNEASDRRHALEGPYPPGVQIPHRVGSPVAQEPVNVATIESVKAKPRKLDQNGGRGFLRHQLVLVPWKAARRLHGPRRCRSSRWHGLSSPS